ncbi:MAG: histidine kinase [Betaproteobacteria bacterium RIFCSPLOWO2_12_FULL_63_13]|nr:MAG: histidine kinase [Betaproteobacteria bacterium RIFCSPLOWO2_12_FULL_63_13]
MAFPIGTASYAAAAAAFLILFLLLVTSWRGRLPGMLLAVASLATAIWAAAAAYLAARPEAAMRPTDALEVLRNAVWFAFLMVLLGYSRKAVRPLRLATVGLAAFCGIVLAVTLYPGVIATTWVWMFGVLGRLVLAVIGMVLVEQLFRNVHTQQRWGIKFLCLGLGGMFAYDFYLYSDTLLFRRVNEDIWAARGVVNALVVPLLAVAAARNPTWSLDVSVSRRFVFHSTAVLGAAVYLLVMAGAGYYIRYFGGSWGVVLQVTFLFGALLLLFVILASGTLRARLRVFLNKNFFSYHYDYREEWLRFTRTLSEGEPGLQLRERSIQAIAELVDSPSGALWLSQDLGAFEPVARWNMAAAKGIEQPESPLCQFLERRQWVINLEACEAQPEFYDGLQIPVWLRAIPDAWLVVPLMLHEQLLGFVVLARSKGKISLNWEVNDILKTAGRQAASYLAQLEAAKALLVARQFESFNRMSAFVVHDLKNLVAQLSLLLSNADRHKNNPAFQEDMIGTVAHSVAKMKRLLVQLRGVYTLEPLAPVALDDLLREVVSARSGLKPVPKLELSGGAVSVAGHPARLERVIGHLVQNAIEATPPDGRVVVRLLQQNGSAVIAIVDSGCGMSEQFMQSRLFRPFESTKATGMGIGTYEAWQYVRELGGRIEVESREAQGTIFRVMLPLHVPGRTVETSAAVESQA